MAAAAKTTFYKLVAPPGARYPEIRIAVIADIHACTPFMDLERVSAIVDQTQSLACDLIVLLGDFSGHVWGGRMLPARDVAERLLPLKAPLGVWSIFGNQDWRDDPDAQAIKAPTMLWHDSFRALGLQVLSNSSLSLDTPQGPMTLAGLESQRAFQTFWSRTGRGADDLTATLQGAPQDAFTLLLAHEPDIFPDLPEWVDLTLSGHTHGGQIVPFGKPLIVPSQYGARYAYGHHQEGQKHLIVSGGLGYSGPPLRLGRPPEIVVVELT